MDKVFSSLITVLSLQCDIYTKLYELSTDKRKALEKKDVTALDKIVKDEQPLMFMLTENERERKNLMSSFAEKLEKPADSITIQEIIDICPQPFLAALKRAQVELTNIVQEQVRINEVNRKLIESRLEYISFMLDTTREDITNAYNLTGSEARKSPRGPTTIDFGI